MRRSAKPNERRSERRKRKRHDGKRKRRSVRLARSGRPRLPKRKLLLLLSGNRWRRRRRRRRRRNERSGKRKQKERLKNDLHSSSSRNNARHRQARQRALLPPLAMLQLQDHPTVNVLLSSMALRTRRSSPSLPRSQLQLPVQARSSRRPPNVLSKVDLL